MSFRQGRPEEISIIVAVEREKVFQAAQKLVEKKRFDKAIVEYQKLIAEDPKDVRTLLRIGDLHIKLEQYADAITTYEQVGQFYAQQGFAGKAIAVYKQMREIINKHVPHMLDRFGHVLPTLAELYNQAGQKSEALAAYDEIATRLLKAGRDRDALKIYEKIIEVEPSNPLPQLRLAEAYMRLKDFDNAIARFGAAANTLVKSGRAADALKVVERILQHRPDVNFARMAAEIYLDRGEPNDAMTALAKLQYCFKENPKDLTILGLLARAFDQLKQKDKALEVLKEAARVAKEAGRAHAFNALIEELVARAPNDAQVKQLASQPMAERPSSSEVEVQAAESDEDIESLIADAEETEEVVIDEESATSSAPEASIMVEASASFETLPPESAMPIALHAHSETATRAKQILTAAESMRLHQQYNEAIKYLRDAIDEYPDERELREKLYDVLFETGDRQGAIDEMMAHASYFSDRGDTETAARILDELLLLEPGYPEATAMLAQLGYALDYDPNAAPTGTAGGYDEAYDPAYAAPDPALDPAANVANPYGGQYYDPNIQNYSDVSGAYPYTGDRRYGHMTSDAPLPNYAMEEESMQFIEAPPSATTGRAMPYIPPVDPATAYPPLRSSTPSARAKRPTPMPAVPPRSTVLSQLDEDALEEIEFFAQHGMFDRAREMLDEQLSRLPNHPLVLEKKRQVDEMAMRAISDRESGTRALPRANEARFAPESNGGLDINAWIDQIDDKFTEMTPNQVQVVESMTQPVDVDSMMEQIKAGSNMPMQISESDAATHYDLGVAYKEMGMFTDAIAEFELASRDPGRECVCLSMIGMIYMQVGEIDAAIDAFIRGLQVRQKTREQEYALTYEVANAYAIQGLPEQALMFFQRLSQANPHYQDPRGNVLDRIRGIDPGAGLPPTNMHSVVQPTDNLDDAFDAMLSRTGRKH